MSSQAFYEKYRSNTPRFEASEEHMEEFLSTLRFVAKSIRSGYIPHSRAHAITQHLSNELQFDTTGTQQTVKISIEEDTIGLVSAGGWSTERVRLPSEFEGFCTAVCIDGLQVAVPAITFNRVVIDSRADRLGPDGFAYIIPVFNELDEPLISFKN